MGKRRTEFEHKDPRAMNDDDDEEDEDDLIIEETPSKEQLESIKQRKKLVPKRKLASGGAASTITSSITNNSPFASLKPFPISSTTTTTSSLSNSNEDSEKPSIFAGFKGFSGFKPLPLQTSSTTTATATQQQPLSTITNSETMSLSSSSSTLKPFSFTATTTTTTTTTTPSVSLFSNGFNSTSATTANNGPTTTLTSTTTTTPISTDINKNGSKSSGEEEKKSESSSSKNINDMEMRFIVGLNELYQRCYGDSLPKRQYKLPADALSGGDSAYTNGSSSIDQAEAKYASLLAELNRNCSKWISKHVEESPFVILTPVFVDYFNYLILLEKSFFPDTFKQQPTTTSTTTTTASSLPSTTTTKSSSSTVLNGESNSNTTPFSFSNYLNGHKENSSEQTFKAPSEKKSIIDFSATTTANKEPSSEFKFTGMPALTTTATTPSTTSFKFGLANATASVSETTASPTKTLSVTPLNTQNKPQLNLPSDITPKSILTENEPKKDTTTAALFKFGSDSNKTDLSTSSTLLGSKPSETASTIFKPFTMSTQSPFSSLVSSSSSSSNTTQNQPAATTTTTTTTPSSIFSFGSGNNQPATTTASPFANLQAGGLAAKSSTLFPSSGGIFSGFSTGGTSILGGGGILGGAGATTQSADAEGGDDEKEEYQPPKPESSDVKEEGSVFTKRCKLYYFSDKEKKFTDRGIGNLFLKPTPPKEGAEPSYQLIVRADNKLAQILLNVKLSKVFPVSRDGPKDISYLCLPNPPIQNVDSNVPCKFLFKVKTEQDAAELLEKLNEYKK